MVEKVILIISTGRTGTKSLAGFFDKHFDNLKSYHQPRLSRRINVLSNMYISGIIPESIFKKAINSLKKDIIVNSEQEYYVEANTMNYISADVLKEIKGKKVYIIHVIRDPRDFVRSYINWKHMRIQSYIANSVLPFWHPSGFLLDDYSLLEWLKLDEFEKNCWYWKEENKIMLDLYSDYEYFKSVRFEDIFLADDKERFLKELVEFVGLEFEKGMMDYFETKKNKSKKEYFPKWDEWGPEKCKKLQAICEDLMDEYDYGEEKEWVKKLGNREI
ncbi:MAG: hypothetical protein ACOCT9_01190 [archaeon]